MSFLRSMSYSPLLLVRAFDHRSRLGLSVAPPFGLGVPQYPCRRHGPLRPLLTSALRSDCLSAASVARATQDRSPGVSSAAFRAPSPDLRFASLMDMDFAVRCPLVRRSRLISGFCPSTRTFALRFFRTPPRDGSPCVLLTLPGRPGEFHSEPPTDPDVNLSIHPARATQRRLPPSIKTRSSSGCPLTPPDVGDLLPLLHGHYPVS